MPCCWQREEVPGQDDVPLTVLGTLWTAEASILRGQRPKKHKGHVGSTAVAETCTAAECDAEGERNRWKETGMLQDQAARWVLQTSSLSHD